MLNSDTSRTPHGTVVPTRLPMGSWATTPAIRRVMQGNRSRDTKPEIAVRSAVHALGMRYRVSARPLRDLKRTADLVFRNARVAVFVDGCFWHGCPEHHAPPKTNASYWATKIQGNKSRDEDTTERLRKEGWTVLRFWSHEEPLSVATQIAKVVATNILAGKPSLGGIHNVNN